MPIDKKPEDQLEFDHPFTLFVTDKLRPWEKKILDAILTRNKKSSITIECNKEGIKK